MNLPVELANAIAHHSDQPALRTLCLVSRNWYSAAIRELYATVDLICASPESNTTARFLWTIVSQPGIGSHIHFLDIYPGRYSVWNGVHTAASLFTPALRAMPNLRHLGVRTIYDALKADETCEEAIFNLSKLESFYSGWCATFDMDHILKRLPPLRRLAWDQSPGAFAELEALIVRSQDKLECLIVRNFNAGYFLRNRAVRFPQLQVLATDWGLDLAVLNGPAFASVTWINAWSFESLQLLGQPDFLPQLRFMRAGMCQDGDMLRFAPATILPRTSSKRVLQYLSIDAMYVRDPDQGQAFPEVEIFEYAEVQSLAMEIGDVKGIIDALRALASIGATTNLKMLSFQVKPQDYTTHQLLIQIVEFAARGHLPNLQFLHLREQQQCQEDWDWPENPAALKAAVDDVNRNRALVAETLPSLEVFEFVIIPLSWKTTAAVRWTRKLPSSGRMETISTLSGGEAAESNIGKRGGRVSNFLRGLRQPREATALPTSKSLPSRMGEEVWRIDTFDSYSALPTPWPVRLREMSEFIPVIDRYAAACPFNAIPGH